MELSTKEIAELKQLKKRVHYDLLLNRLGLLCLFLTFLAYLFYQDFVPGLFAATFILFINTLFATNIKQLLRFSDKLIYEEPENFKKAAMLHKS